ncbi:zinc finger protein 541 isoform X2 [Rhinoderma darwinii]|uniref:zinc finger protein 541 isoform X2 n=1 Tax=Rhinoderma darwinii TaxID=43563 RepID=UPI003F665B62
MSDIYRNLRMDLYRLTDEHGLQPDDLCTEVFQPISDVLQPQLPDHSPSSSAAMLGDNPGDTLLSCRTEEISSDSDIPLSIDNKWDADLDLLGAEGSRLLLNKPCSEKCLQASMMDCKECGKVFSSASSLSKHLVTHSQERSHICEVCKKAFKRHDHLMGHMLTHLKVKPFMCTEHGCKKSYCDFRSLRRHEIHHGLSTKQQKVPTANPYLIPSKALESGTPVLPNNDIIRCLVSEIVQQNVTSNLAVLQDPKAGHVPQTISSCKSNEDFATTNTYTLINSTSKVSMYPDYVKYSNPSPDNPLWSLPVPQSQKIQSTQPNSSASWSFNEVLINGGFMETCAGHLDHRYTSSPASNGHKTMRAESSFTQEPDFKRLSILPPQNSQFQVQNPVNFFPPMTNSQSETFPTLPRMSMLQSIPETNGIKCLGDLKINGNQSGERVRSVNAQEGCKVISSNSETWPKLGRFQRKSSINKDKPSLNLSSMVPASQVALESFAASNKSQGSERMSRLSISNWKDVQDEGMGIWQQKVEPTAQTLESVTWTTKETTAGRLVIPVSVPVTKKDQQEEDKVNEMRSHLGKHTTKSGKKIRPCPKPLYIPLPVLDKNSTSSGRYQSSMRSPDTQLSEYLHNGALQCQYTPPPMLSPIRQGTGLYFNTFCSPSSAKCPPPSLHEEDPLTSGIRLVKDTAVYSVQPHINIGNRFQAVIPECRDRSVLEREDEKADLVWRPCLHNEAMSHLLNLACSSAVPGGGCNLELALHCLHINQGNVLGALDKLLVNDPQKHLPWCLVDYHYAGSDHWTLTEKRQFKNAYYKQRKHFSYIQSVIPGKNISQCVEYYYTWKNIISFKKWTTSAPEQTPGPEQGNDPEKEPHSGVTGKNQKKKTQRKAKSLCSQKETGDGDESSIKFACQECDRVFDKVKSRNAHMKKHRLQEHIAGTIKYESRKQSTNLLLK